MANNNALTVVDLLCYIRGQIVEGRAQKDELKLTKAGYALTMIADAIEAENDPTFVVIVDDLSNVLRNSFIAEYKVKIPSEEEIRSIWRK